MADAREQTPHQTASESVYLSVNPEAETALPADSPHSQRAIGVVRKRAIALAIGVSLVAATFAVLPSSASYRSEKWVGDQLPMTVPGYSYVPSTDPAAIDCTYKMDQGTYDILKPWGIVARVFRSQNSPEEYDVVVIGGNTKDSFHDPNVCFSAQKWVLSNNHVDFVNTKSYGAVPVTMVDMQREGEKSIALYSYRLRDGYVAGNTGAKLQMLRHKLFSLGTDDEGGFIRIIPRVPNTTPEQLKAFAATWMDAAAGTSKGYY